MMPGAVTLPHELKLPVNIRVLEGACQANSHPMRLFVAVYRVPLRFKPHSHTCHGHSRGVNVACTLRLV